MLDVHVLFICRMATIARFFLFFYSSLESKSIPSFLLFFHSPFVPSIDRVSVFPLFICRFQEARVFRQCPDLYHLYLRSLRHHHTLLLVRALFFLMFLIAASKYVVKRTGLSPSPCGTPLFVAKVGSSSFVLTLSFVPFKRKFISSESSGVEMLSIIVISSKRFTVSKADDR